MGFSWLINGEWGVTNHLLTGMILQVCLLGDQKSCFLLYLLPWEISRQQTNTTWPAPPLSQAAASTTKKAISQAIGWIESSVPSVYMAVSKNSGTPKSSIFIGFSTINHPFWGTTIFGNTHISHPGTLVESSGTWGAGLEGC